jgi:hypothetical protein
VVKHRSVAGKIDEDAVRILNARLPKLWESVAGAADQGYRLV